jgi:hypothetical protein
VPGSGGGVRPARAGIHGSTTPRRRDMR